MRKISDPISIMSLKAANGVGTALNVRPFHSILVAISAPLNASLTLKFQGSIGISASSGGVPDFAVAQSITNHWDYVAVYDYQSGLAIAGDTGVVLNDASAASNTRIYLINTDALSWLNIEVLDYVDGSLSAFVVGYIDHY